MFVGSTAQHVVRQATCPVLTVRTRQKGGAVRHGTADRRAQGGTIIV